MSVYILSSSEYGSVAASLHTGRTNLGEPIFPLSMAERFEHRMIVVPLRQESESDYAWSLVDPFVFRLYIANVMAERYTYMKGDEGGLTVPSIELPHSRPLSNRELLKTLNSIAYNVVTNGGNSFLGEKDQEKLDRIISILQRDLAEERP